MLSNRGPGPEFDEGFERNRPPWGLRGVRSPLARFGVLWAVSVGGRGEVTALPANWMVVGVKRGLSGRFVWKVCEIWGAKVQTLW